MTSKTTPSLAVFDDEILTDETKEQQYVHDVYEAIAPHFSRTRYKPWPVVENFLNHMPKGSIGADVGCGNGKYLDVNRELYMVGSDRSSKLIDISASRGFEVLICDALNLPYRSKSFDFVISIAVIHHFITEERRQTAIKELFRISKPEAQILIYVWALEQTNSSRRRFDPEYQDVFVPWAMQKSDEKMIVGGGETEEIIYKRYYHLFREGELENLVSKIEGAEILKSGYDKDNWYVIFRKKV